MAISSSVPTARYTATAGQSIFSYPFRIFEDSNLRVIVDGALQVLSVNYTVTGAGDATGGTVVLTSGVAADTLIIIYREITIERTTDYQPNGDLTAQSLNSEFDYVIAIIQQIQGLGEDGLIRFDPASEGLPIIPIISDIAQRAGKVLSFNSTGQPSLNTELGNFIGDWAVLTTYKERDIVRYNTSIWQTDAIHTAATGNRPGTGSQWKVIIDAQVLANDLTSAAADALTAVTKAAEAVVSAATASTGATTATTKAAEAVVSATTASTGATTATTKATEASASATASAASATAAALSAGGSEGLGYWMPDTAYLGSAIVVNDNRLYRRITSGTSGATFDTTEWTEISAALAVQDNLESDSTTDALSAGQGKTLKTELTTLGSTVITTRATTGSDAALFKFTFVGGVLNIKPTT